MLIFSRQTRLKTKQMEESGVWRIYCRSGLYRVFRGWLVCVGSLLGSFQDISSELLFDLVILVTREL